MNRNRFNMVREIREKYGLVDKKVLSVISKISREEFVDPKYRNMAYDDTPVDIGYGQTISQPYTVAFMTRLIISSLNIAPNNKGEKVLEIGTGSGYQAAVLSFFFKKVYSVEIIPQLAVQAKETLTRLGFQNIVIRSASGEWGWKEHSPFEAVIVTAGLDKVPDELFDQLKNGGVLLAPVGSGKDKIMTRYKKQANGEIEKSEFGVFNFVPFVKQ